MSGYPATRDYLYSLKNRGSKYGIDRMRCFVEALGHPERAFPSIHIAGTNGKGSLCAMLEAIFRANGLRTGMYTSPHLIHQGERVQINREILQEADIVAYTDQLKPIAAKLAETDPDDHPSFFEFMTAMAFLRFAQAEVDIACIETGLGGRLDATNVLTPELSIITTISLDHTELLGDSLEKIAYEKAGIIKPGVSVLIGWLAPEAETVIREIAEERGAPFYRIADRFPEVDDYPETNLTGDFQKRNAALALYACELLIKSFSLKADISKVALQSVVWRGRWETLELDGRTLILDASHNPEGVRELERNLQKLAGTQKQKPLIVAAALGEQRADALVPMLTQYARELYLVAPNQDRALTPQELLKRLPSGCQTPAFCSSIATIFPKMATCHIGNEGDTIVVTGSLYLIGELLERVTLGAESQQHSLQDRP